jgi:ABC-type uncharacterized transport system substrate-binding protein
MLPGLRRVAILGNADSPNNIMKRSKIQQARSFNLEIVVPDIKTAQEIAPTIRTLTSRLALYSL